MAPVEVYYILLPQFGISIVSWAQLVFSMNRYRGFCGFTMTDLWALLIFTLAAIIRWIATMSIRTSSLEFQIFVSFIGAALAWNSFVLVFNQSFVLPTMQQTAALLMSLVVTGLWEVNNRLVYELPRET